MERINLVKYVFISLLFFKGFSEYCPTHLQYYEGDTVTMKFVYFKKYYSPPSKVNWMLLHPGDSYFILISNETSSRFKASNQEIGCSEFIDIAMNETCYIAMFNISDAFFGDIGNYYAQVEDEDCSPCSANFSLNLIPRKMAPEDSDVEMDEEEIDDSAEDTYDLNFFNPPFNLHFNTNSSVCVGQQFQFICYPSPQNYGTNLSLLRVDPKFTDSKLRFLSSRNAAVDFRETRTLNMRNLITSESFKEPLIYNVDEVTKNDTGGYVCVGSLAYDTHSRWIYMHLSVIDCDHANGRPFHERVLEAFGSPTALTFFCLLTAIFLLSLATLVIFICRHYHLPIFLMSPKKFSKAAAKVVMETNHLYPWVSLPHHNCSHAQSKDGLKTTSAFGYYGNTPGVGKNLQVPAVIIQVDNSATNTPGNLNNARNTGCEGKPSIYKIPNDPTWEVERDCVRLGRQIGAGAFGVVYSGVVTEPNDVLPGLRRRNQTDCPDVRELTVAIKTLRDNFNEQELADLVREMEILKQFDPHPHVIQLYGVCTQNGRLQVLVELAPYGNLRNFLMDRRPDSNQSSMDLPMSKLSVHHLVSFGLQVAQGMDYLTRLNIVHRDLAARNILIGDGFVAKIADFGLTRAACDYYRKCSDGRLPIKWMAPESIFDRRYTAKSDVWSFGILLWEIFSYGGTPYPTLSAEALLKALQLGIRNEQPVGSPTTVYNLMLSCWSIDPSARPAFSHLVATLQQVHDDIMNARKHNFHDSSSTSSSGSSSSSSRSTSPPVSTVYLTLNNNNNTEILRTGQQWQSSEELRNQTQITNNVGSNNGFADNGQYLQSVHKAFSMHCNYVVPPRSAELSDYLGDIQS